MISSSINRSFACASGVILFLAGFASGCAETQYRGRDITRHVSLRGEAFTSEGPHGDVAPPLVRAQATAATDAEVGALAETAKAAFDAEIAKGDGERLRPGAGALDRCRVRVILRRSHTYYVARCRANWALGDVVLAVVEAEAKRRVRSQALTTDEVAAIKRGDRHPGILQAESAAAIESAATLAARLLRDPSADPPRYNEDEQRTRDATMAARPATRDRAREDLAHPKASRREAAAIDLGLLGERGDGARVAPLLDDTALRVRRAAAVALVDLATASEAKALFRHRNHPDPLVQRSVATALERLAALHPDLVVPPLGPPPTFERQGQPDVDIDAKPSRPPRKVIGVDDEAPPLDEGATDSGAMKSDASKDGALQGNAPRAETDEASVP